MRPDLAASLDRDGFATARSALSEADVLRLIEAIGDRGGHAMRNLLESIPEVASVARSKAIRSLAEGVLGPDCSAVRGIYFDKTASANWKVAWHQDTTIAVRGRVDLDGFGPWSEKAGVLHVRPPTSILERMIALRIHLDRCGPENGPLRLLPGSHRLGRLEPSAIPAIRAGSDSVACLADPGDVLLMRPLLIHASSTATSPGHRRVVHLEFAADDLPGGLEWQIRS